MVTLDDPAFLGHTFVVIDFEALTPKGRPAEPIEVAAVAGSFCTRHWAETGRFSALMRPPDDVAVTPFDVAQTGITATELRAQRPASQVMAALDARLTAPPYRLVAHHAPTEAGLIARQHEHCPRLATTPLLCTVRLARIAYPELRSHSLDTVLHHLGIPLPPNRHRALPDVELTIALFGRLLTDGAATGRWSTLADLDRLGGVPPKRATQEPTDTTTQQSLF
ncbi:3'-5' exonuclease [Frankia sp. CNm7]|uniref:3'-5' exonuclease n=1 Tax=Frankia nepalensis TaxID=1836974 RepID=A0A937RL88_9ACTN|nr:3'-5' exonuclease [Frankia nepalensis]MBL7499281.1 3'-5' exonuclease [Frankia nepalensis]MBL7512371.1 3'-5' exonuclease [Frankia nepalensis]MBL7522566.1 3'-5' exonuclease [Frankia nepalensis]MBL7632197.1 3'-5' exonuclease [Frankia nepalensis]